MHFDCDVEMNIKQNITSLANFIWYEINFESNKYYFNSLDERKKQEKELNTSAKPHFFKDTCFF